ncbi:MAG: RHS repeat-associated core domain-containing protein, partial [Tenericutes bacterium]|nr:RHS repeat-associated core domain-containing protein [Mycoplasmatota bacterium]
HYIYDAYGNIVDTDIEPGYSNVAEINPYRYRGYRYDEETNLYYLNSRYYDSEIGRFINSDGLLGIQSDIQSTNMIAYCANNPIMYIDPEGESLLLVIFVASLVAFCMVATSPSSSDAGENISVSGGASPDAVDFGAQVMGVGFEATAGLTGVTYDAAGNMYETMTYGGQLGPLGASFVESSDGSSTVSVSLSIIYISVDINDILNVESWGAGLSFSASAGNGIGGASVSYDIDFFGLVVDQFDEEDD